MPVVSLAQNAAMHAAKAGNSTLGIPQSVGEEFTAGQKPGSLKGLPQRVKKPKKTRSHKNGQISERQEARRERNTIGRPRSSTQYGGKDDNNIPGATA